MEPLPEKSDPENAKKNFLFRDRMIKAITKDGHFRAVIIKATDAVESARVRHGLNPLTASILGEMLIGSLLVSSSLKGEERVSLRMETDGPLKMMVAEATPVGEVRGYLNHPDMLPEADTLEEAKKIAIGKGVLNIVKTLYSNAKPVSSVIDIVESSVVKDLTRFFAISEQIPTAIKIDIFFNDDLSVKEAVGLMIQAMPGAPEEDIIDLEVNIIDAANLAKLISKGIYIDEILQKVLRNHEIKELSRTPIDFFCRCNKNRFIDSLKMLSDEDLASLKDEEEVVCHYCSSKYLISKEEILKGRAHK